MKRSLRDFLFTLFISVVIFSVAAFFVLSFVENLMVDVVEKVQDTGKKQQETAQTGEETVTATADAPVEPVKKKDDILTFCVIGVDHNKAHADMILVFGVNATKKEMVAALIPSNTSVPEQNNTLGNLYASRGAAGIQNTLAQEMGFKTDFFAVFTMDGFANLVDFLGGITYSVPENMNYFDSAQGLKIDLPAGSRTLNGEQALGLLAYRGYGEAKRESTQISFVRAFLKAFLKPSNITNAKNMMYNVTYHVNTDFTSNDFNQYADWIFGADTYALTVQRIPGASSGGQYAVSSQQTAALFDHFRP